MYYKRKIEQKNLNEDNKKMIDNLKNENQLMKESYEKKLFSPAENNKILSIAKKEDEKKKNLHFLVERN